MLPTIIEREAAQGLPNCEIAFSSGYLGIFTLNPATGAQERITDEPGSGPVWSPDGTQIAFLQRRGDHALLVANRADELFQPIAINIFPYDLYAWSPDGRTLAYVSTSQSEPEHTTRLYMVEVVTGNARRIEAGNGYYGAPSWSPDGRTLTFIIEEGRRTHAYALDLEWNTSQLLAEDAVQIVWSLDSTRIAFLSRRPGEEGIHVANADGTDRRLVARDGSRPSWSPDGTQIVYDMQRGDNVNRQDIFLIAVGDNSADADDLAEPVAITDAGRNESPVWSPDGRGIAYVSNAADPIWNDLWVYLPASHESVPLTRGALVTQPAWSPACADDAP